MSEGDLQQKISEVFERGVGEFIDPDNIFRKKLEQKALGRYEKDIVVKWGVDPTSPDIHLGHATVLRKLRALQDLGCKIIFLVGDFTAQIGDPTGKSDVRPEKEQAEVEKNLATYLEQIVKILNIEMDRGNDGRAITRDSAKFSWIRNSEWFYGITDIFMPAALDISGLDPFGNQVAMRVPGNSFLAKAHVFEQTRMQKTYLKKQGIHGFTVRSLIWTARRIPYQRLIQRDLLEKRIKAGSELFLHELMYPVFQGIDSHMIANIYGSCDMEVGGTDQTFNMLMGRDIMRINNQEPQSVLAVRLLEGLDGVNKMSKSLNNYIGIIESPDSMFGKIMSMPDTLMRAYFELCTYSSITNINGIFEDLKSGALHPRDVKTKLGKEIVSTYHGEKAADMVVENFMKVFKEGEFPATAPEIKIKQSMPICQVLQAAGLVESGSECSRLINEGAVSKSNGESIQSRDYIVVENVELKIGKKRFLRVIVES